MATAPVQNDREGVRGSERGAVAQADDPGRKRGDMLPEYDRWSPEPLEEAVVDHGLSSSAQLFCWLEHGDESPRPAAGICRQHGTRTQQAGDVHVVSTGVHDRDVHAAVCDGASHACVWQPSLLLDRQGIHVRTQQNARAIPVAKQTDDTGLADASGHIEA
jgi:hypothetical protein